jgi:hypothetical protein
MNITENGAAILKEIEHKIWCNKPKHHLEGLLWSNQLLGIKLMLLSKTKRTTLPDEMVL